jgi:hypothetical protein
MMWAAYFFLQIFNLMRYDSKTFSRCRTILMLIPIDVIYFYS